MSWPLNYKLQKRGYIWYVIKALMLPISMHLNEDYNIYQ